MVRTPEIETHSENLIEKYPLPTFNQAKEILLRDRETSAARTALILNHLLLANGRAIYNGIGYNNQGRLSVMAREEPYWETAEKSGIRKWDWDYIAHAFSPNGFYRINAQDPTMIQLSDEQLGIGFVGLQTDEADPEKITSYADTYYALTPDGQLTDVAITGPLGEKELRFTYAGHGKTIYAPRVRREVNDGYIDSYLRIFIKDTPKTFMGHQERLCEKTENDPHRVNVLNGHGITWVGTEQIIPQLSSNPNELKFAVVFHGGTYRGQVRTEKGRPDLRDREYGVFVAEFTYDRTTGEKLEQGQTTMISSIEDVPQAGRAKRQDLDAVIIGKNLLFVLDADGNVEHTLLFGGAKDRYQYVTELPRNPLTHSIDPRLNRLWTLQSEQMPDLFSQQERQTSSARPIDIFIAA